jgi:hypothetical protein
MNVGRPYGAVVGFLLSPIGVPTFAAASIATALIFWWTAGLALAPWSMSGGLLIWAGIYLYRVARFIARRVVSTIYRQPVRKARSFKFLGLVTLSGLMIGTMFPLRVMLFLHRGAFERVAVHYYEEAPLLHPPPAPTRIGLYAVQKVTVTPRYVFIETEGQVRVCYAPNGPPYIEYRRWWLRDPPWYVDAHFESQILASPIRSVLNMMR